MNPRPFEVGERVFDVTIGWGTVTRIMPYEVRVQPNEGSNPRSYHADGRYFSTNKYRSLYHADEVGPDGVLRIQVEPMGKPPLGLISLAGKPCIWTEELQELQKRIQVEPKKVKRWVFAYLVLPEGERDYEFITYASKEEAIEARQRTPFPVGEIKEIEIELEEER
jgi:hypothetical protein